MVKAIFISENSVLSVKYKSSNYISVYVYLTLVSNKGERCMEEREVVLDVSKDPYLEMIKEGYSPEDIKKMIIEEFNQFFMNKQVLEKNAIEALLPELINLTKLRH